MRVLDLSFSSPPARGAHSGEKVDLQVQKRGRVDAVGYRWRMDLGCGEGVSMGGGRVLCVSLVLARCSASNDLAASSSAAPSWRKAGRANRQRACIRVVRAYVPIFCVTLLDYQVVRRCSLHQA